MKWSFLTLGIIILGITGVGIILFFQQITTSNERDYYLLKETTEAAMTDAVDVGYYRLSGLLRIDKEKFVESFVRRFSQNVSNSRTYDIRFYDINETPPKVSVLVESETSAAVNGESLSLSNKVDVILESKYHDNKYVNDMTRAGKLDYSDVDK